MTLTRPRKLQVMQVQIWVLKDSFLALRRASMVVTWQTGIEGHIELQCFVSIRVSETAESPFNIPLYHADKEPAERIEKGKKTLQKFQ